MGKEKTRRRIFSTNTIYSVYQPIIDIQKKQIYAYEALTRGIGGMRLPEQLFRRSYGDGTATKFDLKCLASAVKALPRLEARYRLFLNVEPMTFAQTFRTEVGAAFLREIKPFARQIVFELTEGLKVRDLGYLKQTVGLVRKMGCEFAIDDVAGIGSKLMRLLSFQTAYLKVDMNVIQGVAKSLFQQKLLRDILTLAREYQVAVIAEGVEKEADLQYVHRAGVSLIQGFYFAKPRKRLQKKIPHLN